MDRIYHLGLRFAYDAVKKEERQGKAVEAEISRSRKRELGLWRKYVAGAVFRTLQAVSDVLQELRR